MEQALVTQLQAFLDDVNYLAPFWSGFRPVLGVGNLALIFPVMQRNCSAKMVNAISCGVREAASGLLGIRELCVEQWWPWWVYSNPLYIPPSLHPVPPLPPP